MSISAKHAHISELLDMGFSPIPIPYREKGPKISNWGKLRLTHENFASYFDTAQMNIGVLLGSASNGLADVDLDCDEAVIAAEHLLPPTSGIFGRESRPRSHRLYFSDAHGLFDQAVLQFKDPLINKMLVELRLGGGGKAAQTVFPGSMHPSGEAVEWDFLLPEHTPANCEGQLLKKLVSRLAAAALLRRYWPQEGGRHVAQLALANWMQRNSDMTPDEIAAFLTAVAGDPTKRAATAADAEARREAGEPAYGYPTLLEHVDAKVMAKVAEWLEIQVGSASSKNRASTATDGDWGEPDMSLLSPEFKEPPRFPSELFGDWADWIKDAALSKGAPPDYVATALLSVVASLIGNTRTASPWAGWDEPSIWWSAIVGKPSYNKSPAMDAVLKPLDEIERQLRPQYDKDYAQYQEQVALAEIHLKQWKNRATECIKKGDSEPEKPKAAFPPDAPPMPTFRVSDATVEKVVEIIANRPKGILLHRDELAGWLGNLNKYGGNGDREFYLEAFGARPYRSERVKYDKPMSVDRLSVSITGSIQPDKLYHCILQTVEDGLAARFIYTSPNPAPIGMPSKDCDTERLKIAYERLLALEPNVDNDGIVEPVHIPLDEGAVDSLQELRITCRAFEELTTGILCGYIGKMAGSALRLALILEHLEWCTKDTPFYPISITVETFNRAKALVLDYFLPMAERCFGDVALAPEIRGATLIAVHINENKLPEFTARYMQRNKFAGLITIKQVNEALAVLIDASWIRFTPQSTGGRPRQLYAVNPTLAG